MNKSPALIGLGQALAIVIYCSLIGGFFHLGNKIFPQESDFWVSILILLLLVFSAAVSGVIVFGYPAYLVLKGKIREALSVFAYTLLYCLGFIAIFIILLTVLE